MQIVIADANALVRKGLRVFLEQQPGWQVAGEASGALELLCAVGMQSPDLVLFDWELPGMPIASLVAALRQICPRAVLISLGGCREQRQQAEQLVDGFASKAESAEKLLALIHAATLPGKPVTLPD